MNVAYDIDGTIDLLPNLFQHLIAAQMAAGDHVFIVTGVSDEAVTSADTEAKTNYLTSLGFPPDSYTKLIIVPAGADEAGHAAQKLQVLKDNNIVAIYDNNVENIKAACNVAVGFLVWNTKEKGSKGTTEAKMARCPDGVHRAFEGDPDRATVVTPSGVSVSGCVVRGSFFPADGDYQMWGRTSA